MILIDVNILLYAVNAASTQHASAREWLDRQLTGPVPVGMPWVVLTGFLWRICFRFRDGDAYEVEIVDYH